MVRCCIENCTITARSPRAKCWGMFGMCFNHAIEFHPEVYEYDLNANRKSNVKRNIRGGVSPIQKSEKPNEEFMLAGIEVKSKN